MQLGGLGSVKGNRSHQGLGQSKLGYPLKIPPLVKERTLVRRSLTLFYFIYTAVIYTAIVCMNKGTVNDSIIEGEKEGSVTFILPSFTLSLFMQTV